MRVYSNVGVEGFRSLIRDHVSEFFMVIMVTVVICVLFMQSFWLFFTGSNYDEILVWFIGMLHAS
jgi:hypothetical protein